jgi:hypothetical protein
LLDDVSSRRLAERQPKLSHLRRIR